MRSKPNCSLIGTIAAASLLFFEWRNIRFNVKGFTFGPKCGADRGFQSLSPVRWEQKRGLSNTPDPDRSGNRQLVANNPLGERVPRG